LTTQPHGQEAENGAARSVRTSLLPLVAGGAIGLASPLVASRVSASTPGWDNLPESLDVLFSGLALAAACVLLSFVLGLRTWRHNRLVLLWIIPIGLSLVIALGITVALLIAPFWSAGWS